MFQLMLGICQQQTTWYVSVNVRYVWQTNNRSWHQENKVVLPQAWWKVPCTVSSRVCVVLVVDYGWDAALAAAPLPTLTHSISLSHSHRLGCSCMYAFNHNDHIYSTVPEGCCGLQPSLNRTYASLRGLDRHLKEHKVELLQQCDMLTQDIRYFIVGMSENLSFIRTKDTEYKPGVD